VPEGLVALEELFRTGGGFFHDKRATGTFMSARKDWPGKEEGSAHSQRVSQHGPLFYLKRCETRPQGKEAPPKVLKRHMAVTGGINGLATRRPT